MIFKAVREGRPYPEHGLSNRDWAKVPPRQVRLDELVTTTKVLQLDRLLSEDSTFFGDLFPHVVRWDGQLYLEDGLHRAVRAALQQRNVLHVRVLELDSLLPPGSTRVEPAAIPASARASASSGRIQPVRRAESTGRHHRTVERPNRSSGSALF